ncbi:hypothetical protein ACFQZV_02255 [Microbacterium koreense]|uniref:DUF385 domain-containing protein n=1 Tax=Microbacterium koreense TaxID=323761 RepID=A0ABW2ZNK9_9MICO
MTVLRALGIVILGLLGAVVAALAVFVVGVRTRHRGVLTFARVVQRDALNPGAMKDAGAAGSSWAIVRVPGRVSGRVYETPVGVVRENDELFISLPYGEGTQWLQNVLAADGATVVHDGAEIEATQPEVVPIVRTPMASRDRVAIAIFGVTHALRLQAPAAAS